MSNHQDAFQAALAQARAQAQKFRDEGKLPPEDITTQAAPKGAQQIIAAGGQEYRDLGLTGRQSHNAIEAGNYSSGNRFGDSGGGAPDIPTGPPMGGPPMGAGPPGGFGGGPPRGGGPDGGSRGGRGGFQNPGGRYGSDQYNKDGYNNSFISSNSGIGPQGGPPRGGYGGRGGFNDHRDSPGVTGVTRRGGFDDGRGHGHFGGPPGRGMDRGRGGPRGRGRGGHGGPGGRGGFNGNGGPDWDEGPQEDPDADYKVFVGGLHRDTTTEKLQEYFKQFGAIKYCQVKVDPATGQSRGFGFVVYDTTEGVDNVIKTLPHTVDGKRVDAKRQHLKTRDGDDKLFCGGVPSDFTDGQLAEFFSSYGMVDAVERPRDMVTGLAKGFAFITFKDPGIVDMIVGQRWLTLSNGARIECKAAVPQSKNSAAAAGGEQSGYGGGYGGNAGHDMSAGQGYVGEDWQNYDWDKLAGQSDQNKTNNQQTNNQAMAGMMPGMEGMSQKQINKSMKKMMKQWNNMMEMMGSGDQSQMMSMMSMMGASDPSAMASMGAPPPPPDEDSKPKRSRFTPY